MGGALRLRLTREARYLVGPHSEETIGERMLERAGDVQNDESDRCEREDFVNSWPRSAPARSRASGKPGSRTAVHVDRLPPLAAERRYPASGTATIRK